MTSFPVTASQILIVWYPLADTRRVPSGLHVTEDICSGPLRMRTSLPLFASQIVTVGSLLAEARCLPVGHQEIEVAPRKLPRSLRMQVGSPVATSMIRSMPLLQP